MRASQARTAGPRDGDPTRVRRDGESSEPTRAGDGERTRVNRDAEDGRRTRAPRGSGDRAPLVLSRYRLHRRLGAGGFGTVWLAHDERLEREVAVKILPRERIIGGRFEREARAAARLSHPGIVTLYEASVDDEGAYLVSELVRGTTLDRLLEAGRLSDRDIVRIGIALCDALDHAHEEGVVHRDVKPSNILIPRRPATSAQLAKLTDFGVARVVGGDTLTRTGDVIGTLAYMAPEQAEGLEAGTAADLYSLALVLYEALTGVNPVALTTPAQRARRLGAHLPPLRRQRRDLPRELGAGIDLALRPRPRERGRILDLRRGLEAALPGLGDEPGVVTAPWSPRGDSTGLTRPARSPEPDAWEPQPPEPDAWEPSAPAPEKRGWRRRAPADEEAAADDLGAAEAPPRVWPARGLAALGAALVAGWISPHLFGAVAFPPALAAILAAGLTLLLPRLGWTALLLATIGAAIAHGHGGLALVAGVGLVTPTVLAPLTATLWPVAAGAGVLAAIGLAGAWPALAAAARTPWRRAAVAATGWLWLLVMTAITGRVSVAGPMAGLTPAAAWADSVPRAAEHGLAPLGSSAALIPAAVWALGAVCLPWLLRGRSLLLDGARAVGWAAAVALASSATVKAVGGPGAAPIHGALLGAVCGAALALAWRWSAAWSRPGRRARRGSGLGPHFP